MRITIISFIKNSITIFSNKTGFGPYRFHRKRVYFVGDYSHPLKYHHVSILYFYIILK